MSRQGDANKEEGEKKKKKKRKREKKAETKRKGVVSTGSDGTAMGCTIESRCVGLRSAKPGCTTEGRWSGLQA